MTAGRTVQSNDSDAMRLFGFTEPASLSMGLMLPGHAGTLQLTHVVEVWL